MGQHATGRFRSAGSGKIDLFGIDLSAHAINHKIYKQELRLIVNTLANDLQYNLHQAGGEAGSHSNNNSLGGITRKAFAT